MSEDQHYRYDIETFYQLRRFVELYNKSVKVCDFTTPIDSEEFKAFQQKDGLPVGLVYGDVHNKHYPLYAPFFDFYNKSKHFWIIPCELPSGGIIGFVLRSYSEIDVGNGVMKKKYMIFNVKKSFPIVYGLHRFSDFKLNTPIIVSEGIKDCIFISKYYRYTISVLTSSITDSIAQMLSKITDRVIIAFDNDSAGKSGVKKSRKTLSNYGMISTEINSYLNIKDWGNMFSVGMDEEILSKKMSLTVSSALNKLGCD